MDRYLYQKCDRRRPLAGPALTADDTITVAAMTLEGSFPADMSLTVELTNNALDDAPVWENCTDIQRGESRAFAHHAFTNKTAARERRSTTR